MEQLFPRADGAFPDGQAIRAEIRRAEDDFRRLFSREAPFSPHLFQWRDDELPDMYDHNAFVARGAPTADELTAAEALQKARGLDFLKLESRERLEPAQVGRFRLAESVTLAMALIAGDPRLWTRNPRVEIRDLKDADLEADLLAVEEQNYGDACGADFIRRKLRRYADMVRRSDGFHYFGAYRDGRIEGACHAFCSGGWVELDGLVVNGDARKQYVATTLLAEAVGRLGGRAFLHADAEDTPRFLYERLGFRAVDTLFEYDYRE